MNPCLAYGGRVFHAWLPLRSTAAAAVVADDGRPSLRQVAHRSAVTTGRDLFDLTVKSSSPPTLRATAGTDPLLRRPAPAPGSSGSM